MPQDKNLQGLFTETLKDIYFAEKQIFRALPKMAKAAKAPQLREAFRHHQEQTEGQIERLEQVFEMIGKPPRGKQCQAILGIIEEASEIIEDFRDSQALDAGLLASAQAVEHYEISRYGTLRSWAQRMGLKDAVSLLDETLNEEKETDSLLSELAEAHLNAEAA
jgi:ferritin-like metal-binding protein YciE